jgi:hypothetical protein
MTNDVFLTPYLGQEDKFSEGEIEYFSPVLMINLYPTVTFATFEEGRMLRDAMKEYFNGDSYKCRYNYPINIYSIEQNVECDECGYRNKASIRIEGQDYTELKLCKESAERLLSRLEAALVESQKVVDYEYGFWVMKDIEFTDFIMEETFESKNFITFAGNHLYDSTIERRPDKRYNASISFESIDEFVESLRNIHSRKAKHIDTASSPGYCSICKGSGYKRVDYINACKECCRKVAEELENYKKENPDFILTEVL